jgi:hypothetical protein
MCLPETVSGLKSSILACFRQQAFRSHVRDLLFPDTLSFPFPMWVARQLEIHALRRQRIVLQRSLRWRVRLTELDPSCGQGCCTWGPAGDHLNSGTKQVARIPGYAVRTSPVAIIAGAPHSIAVSKLRRPFLSDFPVAMRLLTRREPVARTSAFVARVFSAT